MSLEEVENGQFSNSPFIPIYKSCQQSLTHKCYCYAESNSLHNFPPCPSSLMESHDVQTPKHTLVLRCPFQIMSSFKSDHQLTVNLRPLTPTLASCHLDPGIILNVRLRQPVKAFALPPNLEVPPSRVVVVSATLVRVQACF